MFSIIFYQRGFLQNNMNLEIISIDNNERGGAMKCLLSNIEGYDKVQIITAQLGDECCNTPVDIKQIQINGTILFLLFANGEKIVAEKIIVIAKVTLPNDETKLLPICAEVNEKVKKEIGNNLVHSYRQFFGKFLEMEITDTGEPLGLAFYKRTQVDFTRIEFLRLVFYCYFGKGKDDEGYLNKLDWLIRDFDDEITSCIINFYTDKRPILSFGFMQTLARIFFDIKLDNILLSENVHYIRRKYLYKGVYTDTTKRYIKKFCRSFRIFISDGMAEDMAILLNILQSHLENTIDSLIDYIKGDKKLKELADEISTLIKEESMKHNFFTIRNFPKIKEFIENLTVENCKHCKPISDLLKWLKKFAVKQDEETTEQSVNKEYL